MPIRNQNWYDLQATRRYPLDDRSTGMDDDGNIIRDSVIVDCNLRFPESAGAAAYVQAINVSGTIVTVLIGVATFNEEYQSFDTTTIAAVSLAKPIVTNKNYPVTPIIPGVAGWIVFGAGIAENFYGRYSTPTQSLLLTRCAKKYSALPVQSIGKSGLDSALTDIVNIEVEAPIVVQKTQVPVTINNETRTVTALEFSLATAIASIETRPAEYFLGPCAQRPESGTCPKTPIESINNVTPDCYGNINISVDGIAEIYMFQDCGGLGIDLPRGLADACAKTRYASPLPPDDVCAQDTPTDSSSSSSSEPPLEPTSSSSSQLAEQSSSSLSGDGGGGGGGLTLPLCEPFNDNLANILSVRRGNFISAAVSAPDKCPSLPILGLRRMPIKARMSLTSPDWDNYITDHLGNILTTASGDELIWATTTATAPSSTSLSSAAGESSESSSSRRSSSSSTSPEERCRLALRMQGAANSTVFTDTSFFTNSVVVKGATSISATQSRFGGGSAYFSGAAGAGLRVVGPASQNIAPTADANFTIEAWIYPEKDSGVLVGNYLGTGSWLVSLASGNLRFTFSGATSVTINASAPIALNEWTHIAICRANGVIRLFCNGVLVGSGASTQISSYVNAGGLGIGTLLLPTGASYGANTYQGYMNNLRIVQTALYPQEFSLYTQDFNSCFDPAGELITRSSSSESSSFAETSSSSAAVYSSTSSAEAESSTQSSAVSSDSSDSSAARSSSSSAFSSSSSIYSSSSSSSSSSAGLSLKITAATDSVTTINLATLLDYATDWAINTDISTEFKIVPSATNNAGLVFNYTTSFLPSGASVANYLVAKVDADADAFLLLRYNGSRFVTEYQISLSSAGFKFDYDQWYKLTASPTTITSSSAVAVTCMLEKLNTQQTVEFTVAISNYGIPMGAPGIFADRAYAYFNKLTVV